MTFLVKILLLLVISANCLNALQLGRCPFVRPQVDFDVSNFVGKWYEQSKYPIASEILSKCTTLELEQLPNGTYSVLRTITGKLTDVQVGLTGVAAVTDTGVLELSHESLGCVLGHSTVSILGTDYSNYAVIFSCEELLGLGILHQPYAFVLTRQRQPSEEVIDAAKNALKSNGLSVRNLRVTDQVNCPANH